MSQRVLIIGWDGGTWRVFRPLAEKGWMPRLRQVMDRGASGVMTSTIPPVTPPAWTTLMTGLKPERHGVFGFMEGMLFGDSRKAALASARPVSALSFRGASLIELLGQAGRKVMCINVPMSYPPRKVNGIIISGMLTPQDAEDYTWPPELRDELVDYDIDIVHGENVIDNQEQKLKFDRETWVRRCTEIVERRAENVCRLGLAHAWDFGIVVFTGTDRVFHPLWPEIMTLLEKDAPTTDIERLLVAFFTALDDALGRLVDTFSDATVLLTSDHGFGPRAERTVYPDLWLEEKGYLVRSDSNRPQSGVVRQARRTVRRTLRRAIEMLLPRKLSGRLLRRVDDRQTRMLASIDRERSRAFFCGFDAMSFAGIRLVEETTSGLSDAEREALIDEVIASLREMRDPDTGERILREVHRREGLFPDAVVMVPGSSVLELTDDVFDARLHFIPDIILRFREGYTGRVDPLATELLGPPPPGHVGVHRIEGMYLLVGDGVKVEKDAPAIHLADVAPTVLWLLDCPVPHTMQGKPCCDRFDDPWVADHPVQLSGATPAGGATTGTETDQPYTPEQEEQIKENLRRLGYID